MRELVFDDARWARATFGHRDEHLRQLERDLPVRVHVRGEKVSLDGDDAPVDLATRVLHEVYALAEAGHPVTSRDVTRAVRVLGESASASLLALYEDHVLSGVGTRTITPKTVAQKHYVDQIRGHDIVYGVGPAGTGKTYLAMAAAISALLAREVKRIVLTRPAVEAGERLGFLPGDMQQKVSPYLRPLQDALHDMLGVDRATQLVDRGVIEIAPLAFMRGRTLNASFVILDEAQNTTREQMKMFLTRLGFDSKAVITGDTSQVDLVRKRDSGLRHSVALLEGVDGIAVTRFTRVDVVRHPLVARIIDAYDAEDQRREAERGDRAGRETGDAGERP